MFGASIGLMPIISKPSFFISTLDFNNMLTDLGVYFRFAHFKHPACKQDCVPNLRVGKFVLCVL